jgi:hypothetical protein
MYYDFCGLCKDGSKMYTYVGGGALAKRWGKYYKRFSTLNLTVLYQPFNIVGSHLARVRGFYDFSQCSTVLCNLIVNVTVYLSEINVKN